jgi:hypothetical protein
MKMALASIFVVLALSSTAFAGDKNKLEVKTPTDAKKGQPAVALVHIEGTSGFVLNTEYPVKLVITPPFTSSDAGQKAFTGELKFAVATAKDSVPVAETLSFTVDVK